MIGKLKTKSYETIRDSLRIEEITEVLNLKDLTTDEKQDLIAYNFCKYNEGLSIYVPALEHKSIR